MRALFATALSGLVVTPVLAGDMTLKVTIPRLNVVEYHRPYVAIWIERPDRQVAANLAVWYDLDQKNMEGNTWLKDLRQWWRRSGRSLQMPVDGISGATRPPGEHELTFATGAEPLKNLPAGAYELIVEAAREVGGRELLRIPFQWPPDAPHRLDASGTHELGGVILDLKP